MPKMNGVLFLIIATIIDTTSPARILGIMPSPFYSHHIVFKPIWKALSLRGHQVTLITTDPINNPNLTNLTEININFSYKYFDSEKAASAFMDEETNSVLRYFKVFISFRDTIIEMTEAQLEYSPIQNLIKDESQKFDLLMMEVLNPVMLAFGKRFDCPIIGLLPFEGTTMVHEAMGNPTHPALYPDVSLALEGRLTFFERLQSFVYVVAEKLLRTLLSYIFTPLMRKHFGEEYSELFEMMTNIDMMFLSTNPILSVVRPNVPSIILIGDGSHMDAPKQLPKEIKDFLDSASDGVIYFSFGTIIKSNGIPEKLRQIIIETLSELPYKVLWKFEADDLPGKPSNVKIMKWLPQQDVLRHPNVKLFITHGGLHSMEEALLSHVPLVVMPFMGDQDTNAKKVVSRGYGLSVDRRTLTKEILKQTILEVLTNDKYRNKVKEVAELALDQPVTGIDSALWWTEYVLRHKGAKHLRSPAVDMPWYQYLLLDVIAFILVVVVAVTFVAYKILKITFNFTRSLVAKRKVKTH